MDGWGFQELVSHEERLAMKKIITELKDTAAEQGITLTFSDLTGEGDKKEHTLRYLLPIALKAINEADLIVVLAGKDELQSPMRSREMNAGKTPLPWIVASFDAAIDAGFTSIKDYEDSTLLEIQLRHYLTDCTTTAECFTYIPTQLPRSRVDVDVWDELSAHAEVTKYTGVDEFTSVVAKDLTGILKNVMDSVRIPTNDFSEEGAQAATIQALQRVYVDVDFQNIKHLGKAMAANGNKITLVQGKVGSGKTTLLANYASRVESEGGKVFFHNFGLSCKSSKLHVIMRRMLASLAPAGYPRIGQLTSTTADLKEMLRELPKVIDAACMDAAPKPVTAVLAGLDLIESREFCVGDHKALQLNGPKMFTSERCVFALQNLIPGDVLDRNKIIVKPRRATDQECVSPIVFEQLVDGRGVAVQMIRSGAQLSGQDITHPDLQISDAETLRLGLGLVVKTERGRFGGKDEISVSDVVEQGPAYHAGVDRGTVIVQVAGQSLLGVTLDEAVRMLIANNSCHLLVETRETARQHTYSLGWLPSRIPTNFRLLVSAVDGPVKRAMIEKKECLLHNVPTWTYGHTDKLATRFAAEIEHPSQRDTGAYKKFQTMLTPEQLKRLSQGFASGTLDKDGNDMYLVCGGGFHNLNGWYRLDKNLPTEAPKQEEAADKAAAAKPKEKDKDKPKKKKKIHPSNFTRRYVEVGTAKRMSTLHRMTSSNIWNRALSKIDAERANEPDQTMIECALRRVSGEHKGWVLIHDKAKKYGNTADSNAPPGSYWASVDGVGHANSDPPPKVYNLSKLAASRTPVQIAQMVSGSVLDEKGQKVDIPEIYIVEGAGHNDINGWYVRGKNDGNHIVYINRNSPSGTVYTITGQKGTWTIVAKFAEGDQKLYRCSGTDTASNYWFKVPPPLNWTPIRDEYSQALAMEKLQHGSTKGSTASPDKPNALAPKHQFAKMHAGKLKEEISACLSVVKRMNRLTSEEDTPDVTPRVRSLVAPCKTPLFLRLAVGDIYTSACCPSGVSEFHFHHASRRQEIRLDVKRRSSVPKMLRTSRTSRMSINNASKVTQSTFADMRERYIDASIVDVTGCGDVGNLVQMRLDHCENAALFCRPGAVRAILYLIYCSYAGMMEEELAELATFTTGSYSLDWARAFGIVKPLLTCFAGRWNFAHSSIRQNVCERYSSQYVEWAYFSTVYSYFLTAKNNAASADADVAEVSVLRQQRADEELEDRSRFPRSVFRHDLTATSLKFEEVRLIGWAMKYNCTLTSLRLSSNRVGNRGARLIAEGVQYNRKLTRLDLSDNGIGVDGANAIAQCLRHNHNLQYLDMTGNRITEKGAEELGHALKNNHGVSTLMLADNELGCDGAAAIAVALRSNATLTELSLAHNDIHARGVRQLAEVLKQNTTLSMLSLGSNPLGSDGYAAFSMCLAHKTRGLSKIDLSNTGLDEQAMKHLGDGLRENSSILSIDVSKNSIGDTGSVVLGDMLSSVEVLHVNSSLSQINASSNKITANGAKRFLEAIQVNGAILDLDLTGNEIDNKTLDDVENWLKINRKLSVLGECARARASVRHPCQALLCLPSAECPRPARPVRMCLGVRPCCLIAF